MVLTTLNLQNTFYTKIILKLSNFFRFNLWESTSYIESDMSLNESTSDSNEQLVNTNEAIELVEPNLRETIPKNNSTTNYNVNRNQNFSRLSIIFLNDHTCFCYFKLN